MLANNNGNNLPKNQIYVDLVFFHEIYLKIPAIFFSRD